MSLSLTPVVLAFTPNYLVPAATCILSILKHSEANDKFHVICLLSEPLPEDMKEKLSRLDNECLRFSFMNLQGKLKDIYVDEKYTIAASYRLLLPELLPEYEKVLYIDCDVVVRNNLAKLYRETDLGNNYLAGVFEATLSFQLPHMNAIGCEPGSYINSGFLIMNLELLRRDNMMPKFLKASNEEGLEFPDQDVLNQLCKGRILGLAPYYNSIRTFYLPQYKIDFLKYYTEKDWQAVQEHGTVHYTGAKPWNAFTIEFSIWWKYYEMLPVEIRKAGVINKKMQYLYKLYSTTLGNLIINKMQGFYRKIKYKAV